MSKMIISHDDLVLEVEALTKDLEPGDFDALENKFKEKYPDGIRVMYQGHARLVTYDHKVIRLIWKFSTDTGDLLSKMQENTPRQVQHLSYHTKTLAKQALSFNDYEVTLMRLAAQVVGEDTQAFVKLLTDKFPSGVEILLDGTMVVVPINNPIHVEMFLSFKARDKRLAEFKKSISIFAEKLKEESEDE